MKSFSKLFFALYLLILLWLLIFKLSFDLSYVFDYQTRSLNLIPFANLSRDHLREMAYNTVVFVPFGLLLGFNFKRAGFWQKLALIFMFSLDVELIQFIFAIGVTDITDVITNTFGGLLGLVLYDVCAKYVDKEKLDRFIVVAGAILLVLCLLILGFLVSRNVRYHSRPRTTEMGWVALEWRHG